MITNKLNVSEKLQKCIDNRGENVYGNVYILLCIIYIVNFCYPYNLSTVYTKTYNLNSIHSILFLER